MRQVINRFFLLPLLFVLACVGAFAQANSTVTGIVTDQTGAVVAGAKIALTDPATGATKLTVSGVTGLYDIAGLIAPRPLFAESGEKDDIFPVEASRASFVGIRFSIWPEPLSDFNGSAESSRSKLAKFYCSSDACCAGNVNITSLLNPDPLRC